MKIDLEHLHKNLNFQQVAHYLKFNIKLIRAGKMMFVYGLPHGPLAINIYLLILFLKTLKLKFSLFLWRISKNYVIDKNDFEIFEMCDSQILKTESKLEQYLSDILTKQTIGTF